MSDGQDRVVPYYCPYCASEDLRPAETHGVWECRSCARAFSVKFVGLSSAQVVAK
jgi:ribosomal protein L37AE/L43A